jgi:hypothetical protein
MLAWPAAVAQNLGVGAAGILQRVGQHRQVLETAAVVDALGHGSGNRAHIRFAKRKDGA